jgi:hypothetical protein
MNQGTFGGLSLQAVAVWAVVLLMLIARISVPRRISIGRLWFSAALLMAIGAFAVLGYERMHPAAVWQIVVAVFAGLAAGLPVGILRGLHTQVSLTERPGVMKLGPSWATAAIYLAAFVIRGGIRYFVPITSPAGTVVGDALLVFAITIVGASNYVVYRKYEALSSSASIRQVTTARSG